MTPDVTPISPESKSLAEQVKVWELFYPHYEDRIEPKHDPYLT
jgi:hypothetical protein